MDEKKKKTITLAESDVIDRHWKLLEVYRAHRRENPLFTFRGRDRKFTFHLRAQNRKNRLEMGYVFQGHNTYIYTSPYKFNDGDVNTQRINFGWSRSGVGLFVPMSNIQVDQKEKKYEKFFRDVIEKILGEEYDRKRKRDYEKVLLPPGNLDLDEWIKLLKVFLNETVPEINKIAEDHRVKEDDLFYSDKEYEKRLKRIHELKEARDRAASDEVPADSRLKEDTMPNDIPKNQILFGPPGTGKTFRTVADALKILGGGKPGIKSVAELEKKFPDQVKFITFHQSFAYEDFIEGIKPVLGDDDNSAGAGIRYEIQDGIFKQICEQAKAKGINKAIEKAKEDLMDNWVDLQTENGKSFSVSYQGYTTFRIRPENSKVDFAETGHAAGRPVGIKDITKLYEDPEAKGIRKRPYALAILEYLKQHYKLKNQPQKNAEKKKFVLIIDEINRGNISKIFGELITLLEPTKREGADETISVTLPYSKESFTVPNNLYIIGTMNTADRSIALLDTALRRRFRFVEMMPKTDLAAEDAGGVDCRALLKAINERIKVLMDREHQIGHSYLMPEKVKTLVDLKSCFQNEILPLLQEYFYGQWDKIDLVLNGNGFVEKKSVRDNLLKTNDYVDTDQKVYELLRSDSGKWLDAECYRKIYDSNTDSQGNDTGGSGQ